MTTKKTCFKSPWLTNNAFTPWIGKSSLDTQAYCKLCKFMFELGNMGKKVLNSYAKGKGHSKEVQDQAQIKNFFNSKTKSKTDNSKNDCSIYDNNNSNDILQIETPSSSRIEKVQATIPTTYYDERTMFAETRWALKQVLCGCDDNSWEGTVNLFVVMLPDSKIAASVELHRNKLKYILNHGLASYFKNILTEDLVSADFLSVCFDECLNKTTQNCEMDWVLRYWDNLENKVQVRYWNSMFMGHGTASDLFAKFNERLKGIDLTKLIQVSMDGPSVNWKFYEKVEKSWEEAELGKLGNIGSCSLNGVHETFKSDLILCY